MTIFCCSRFKYIATCPFEPFLIRTTKSSNKMELNSTIFRFYYWNFYLFHLERLPMDGFECSLMRFIYLPKILSFSLSPSAWLTLYNDVLLVIVSCVLESSAYNLLVIKVVVLVQCRICHRHHIHIQCLATEEVLYRFVGKQSN